MRRYVRRSNYLDLLRCGKDQTQVVKVITGMRRCGKTVLLKQYIADLLAEGVAEEDIISINFESMVGQSFKDSGTLNAYLADRIRGKERAYVFLDEIQNVEDWEMTIAALCVEDNCDIYITGSNSKMLSSELSTHLSGRYVEVPILPLSFKEYAVLRDRVPDEALMQDYLEFGALPDADPGRGEEHSRSYLYGLYSTILLKDILKRLKTDDTNRISTIARFLYSNIGNECSVHSISVSTGLTEETVRRYIDAMCAAMLFHRAEKYDIVGKKILSTRGKYYASDLGMRNAVLEGAGGLDISRPLENVVFLELRRRGYTVRIGGFKDSEVDFTAVRDGVTEYFQVTQTMLSDETKAREFRAFTRIHDNFRKTILTMDRVGLGQENGIEVANVLDWLCGDGSDNAEICEL